MKQLLLIFIFSSPVLLSGSNAGHIGRKGSSYGSSANQYAAQQIAQYLTYSHNLRLSDSLALCNAQLLRQIRQLEANKTTP